MGTLLSSGVPFLYVHATVYQCVLSYIRVNNSLSVQDAAKQKTSSAGSTPAVSKPSSKVTPHYKLSIRPTAKFQTFSTSSPSQQRGKSRLFQGLDDSGSGAKGGGGGLPKETFVPRKSIKTLIIPPKPSPVSW